MTLQQPTYQDIQTRFNLTSQNNSLSNLECIIGSMELSVFDDNNEAVVPGQANLPFGVNLTLGVIVQNAMGEYGDLVYFFESDNDYPLVQMSVLDNWATIRLQQGKKRQRFTVLVDATRTICGHISLHCVGMSWIEFANDTGNSLESPLNQTNELEKQILKNTLAFKRKCLQISRKNRNDNNLKASEHSTNEEIEFKSENMPLSDEDSVIFESLYIFSTLEFDFDFFLWTILLIITALAVVFFIQMIRLKWEEASKCKEPSLSSDINERIIAGRGGSRSYKVTVAKILPKNTTSTASVSVVLDSDEKVSL